jgi:hypothetical protein
MNISRLTKGAVRVVVRMGAGEVMRGGVGDALGFRRGSSCESAVEGGGS